MMAQAQSICSLCNYGVAYTRIQSMGKEKEREGKREEKRKHEGQAKGPFGPTGFLETVG